MHKTELITLLQDNKFMGYVEEAGAKEIRGSAIDAVVIVEDFGLWFNVVYEPIKAVASKELLQYEK